MNSIKTLEEIKEIRQQLKDQNKKVVFTNGCFDLIHAGHVDYLSKAKALGDVMSFQSESIRRCYDCWFK